MSEIPMDAKILMDEFLSVQKEQEAVRALEKQKLAEKEVVVSVGKPLRPKEVIRYARSFGFEVSSGGNHGVHLVAPNGSERPLPFHGGGKTLANGTQRSIMQFIQQNAPSTTTERRV